MLHQQNKQTNKNKIRPTRLWDKRCTYPKYTTNPTFDWCLLGVDDLGAYQPFPYQTLYSRLFLGNNSQVFACDFEKKLI